MSNMRLQTSPGIESQEDLECVHYWIIDVPSGPVSKGKCRVCGESKEFRNSLAAMSVWDDDRNPSQVSTAGRPYLGQLGGVLVKSEEEED